MCLMEHSVTGARFITRAQRAHETRQSYYLQLEKTKALALPLESLYAHEGVDPNLAASDVAPNCPALNVPKSAD